MRLAALLCYLLFSLTSTQAQSLKQQRSITRDVSRDLDLLIPAGQLKVDVRDEMKVSPRRAELLQRFTESIRENSEWFMQAYKKTLETNEKLAYDSRLGLSEEEWKEFGKMNEENIGIEMVSSSYERVTVKRKKGVISFKTGEKLDALNELTIDTKRNKVTMFGYELAPQDTICVVDPTNVFKSTWRGYKWQYVEPEDATMPTSQEELANFFSHADIYDRSGRCHWRNGDRDLCQPDRERTEDRPL
jgi:hypothetical protein